MTPEQFIAKWRHNSLSERAGAQAHFLDLCELLGVDKPGNPNENDNYCFERGAKRTGAGRGWADVWKRGHFAWEYKAPRARLDAALRQLMTYALALDNPPLLVVSDRLVIEIHTHFTSAPSATQTILLASIGSPENLQRLKWLFTEPERFKPERTRTAITKQAAELFADLAQILEQRGHEPHKVAHFLNKMLFCMFAESAASIGADPLLPSRLFSKVLHNGLKDPKRFEKQLRNLFSAMAEPHGEFGEHIIEWFNGGLFDDDVVIPLTADDIQKIVNVSILDWSAIEPSIFGTLFERGLDPAKRSQLGAHYTDPGSIMRIVNPVIVEPLLTAWSAARTAIATHMDVFSEHENSRKPAEKGKATTALKEANRLYVAFLEKLKNFRVLDPACGSGNFLYRALQSLKDIEHRVILEAEELGLERAFHQVGPETLHGIEINPYAAELARVTVWIGEIQWMLKHGLSPSRNPILKKLDQIECRDALLTVRPERVGGLPVCLEAGWPQVDVIIGNPPFLGGSKMREELGNAYTETLRLVYQGRVPGGADLVCYWFAKAQDAIEDRQAARAGLVATNSIRQPVSRPVLERIVADGEIFNAWSDEPWINEGAAVRVSIICFSPASSADFRPTNNGAIVEKIHADLTHRISVDASMPVEWGQSSNDITRAKPLPENQSISFQGIPKAGAFDIPGNVARNWLVSDGNPHRQPNSAVLRPLMNGLDVTRRARDMWIIDFGSRMSEREAALFEGPFNHVRQFVKPERDKNSEKSSRELWWRHQRPRPEMVAATSGLKRFIVTPEVAKHRPFIWLRSPVLPDKMLIVIARDDDTSFGLVSSRMHVVWALGIGGTLEDRPRYNPTVCFQTFPFPEGLTPNLKPEHYTNPHAAEIAAAAKWLNELRENWLNPPEWVERVAEVVPGYPDRIIAKAEFAKAIKERTLTKLYNKRANGEVQWLEDAHRTLDAAVARAYGWDDYYTAAMRDEEILQRLLALNLARSSKS